MSNTSGQSSAQHYKTRSHENSIREATRCRTRTVFALRLSPERLGFRFAIPALEVELCVAFSVFCLLCAWALPSLRKRKRRRRLQRQRHLPLSPLRTRRQQL